MNIETHDRRANALKVLLMTFVRSDRIMSTMTEYTFHGCKDDPLTHAARLWKESPMIRAVDIKRADLPKELQKELSRLYGDA